MNDEKNNSKAPIGRPLAVDHISFNASQTEPGFIARPPGAPVYHGFQVVDGVSADEFRFGKITDFEAEPCDSGDAFVIAPDDGRAGLVWEVSDNPYFKEVCPLEPHRWGVWGVSFPHAMDTRDNARRNLESILPELKKRWKEWHEKYSKEMTSGPPAANQISDYATLRQKSGSNPPEPTMGMSDVIASFRDANQK